MKRLSMIALIVIAFGFGVVTSGCHSKVGEGTSGSASDERYFWGADGGEVVEPDPDPEFGLSAPAGVTAIPGDGMVSVSWQPVADADSYNVYWSFAAGGSAARVSNVASPYVHRNIANNRYYFYRVSAQNEDGEGAKSIPVYAMPVRVQEVPAAPNGVTVRSGRESVTIDWTLVAGASDYTIYYGKKSGVSKEAFEGKIQYARPSQNISDLAGNTTYFFVVTASNYIGEGDASEEVSTLTLANDTSPESPVGLQATANDGSVDLQWGSVDGASGYRVYDSSDLTDQNYTDYQLASDLTDTNYSAANLTNDTEYHFVVTAFNAAGDSEPSNVIDATPVAEVNPPAKPVNLTGTSDGTSVILTWNEVLEADTYIVTVGEMAL